MEHLSDHTEIPEDLLFAYIPTGSNYVCEPPVTDTDVDFVLCANKGNFEDLITVLEQQGYKQSNQDRVEYELNEEGFYCCRRGNINLILTENKEFFLKWCKGTDLAKKMNLLEKSQRIALFQYILYDII